MDIKSRTTYVMAVAKWKLDHEMRLNGLRGKLNSTQDQIVREKYRLADQVLMLHREGKITEETLLEVCSSIDQLSQMVKQYEREIETVKQETLPQHDAKNISVEKTRLVCPNCGRDIPIKFCPKCGTEGVLSTVTNTETQTDSTNTNANKA